MVNFSKKLVALTLVLVLSSVLVAAMVTVKAQGTPTIDILTTVGGTATADPAAPYTDGQTVTLTATPGNGFIFQNWVIVSAEGATSCG